MRSAIFLSISSHIETSHMPTWPLDQQQSGLILSHVMWPSVTPSWALLALCLLENSYFLCPLTIMLPAEVENVPSLDWSSQSRKTSEWRSKSIGVTHLVWLVNQTTLTGENADGVPCLRKMTAHNTCEVKASGPSSMRTKIDSSWICQFLECCLHHQVWYLFKRFVT